MYFLEVDEPETSSCGAKTRQGASCRRAPVAGRRRCRAHGGASTGVKTAAGRQRIVEAQRRRWAKAKLKTVRIVADRPIHDGLGRVHEPGATAQLPPDVVAVFLERKLAVLVEG
jgi:hypothetical protein